MITDAGELSYDYLIVAAGATTNYFGMDSVAKHAFSMKNLNESVAIRNHILNIFEQASKGVGCAKAPRTSDFCLCRWRTHGS